MPKKKESQDAKKTRKSTSKDTSVTSPGAGEIVLPPNPTATHLVASNPFDDPPPNVMKVAPTGYPYAGQSMVRLPPNGGMGSYPGWNRPELRGMRPPYSNPGGPGWSMPVHGSSGMNPPHPMYSHVGPSHSMPNNGYAMNRPHYAVPGMAPYRGSPRMFMGNPRQAMGPLGSPTPESMMMESPGIGSNHDMGFTNMASSGNQGHMLQNTGQMMKALTRPPAQQASPTATAARKSSTSSSKTTEGKSPKSGEPSTKARKKSEKKSQESKAKAEAEKAPSASSCDFSVPPHSILPVLPQVCKGCSTNITSANEEVIRCLASCKNWYHRTCVGLSDIAYKHLKTEELAVWACDSCLQTKEIFSVQPRTPFLEQLSSAA